MTWYPVNRWKSNGDLHVSSPFPRKSIAEAEQDGIDLANRYNDSTYVCVVEASDWFEACAEVERMS